MWQRKCELAVESGGVSNELALVNKPLAEWFTRRSRQRIVAAPAETAVTEQPLASTAEPVG